MGMLGAILYFGVTMAVVVYVVASLATELNLARSLGTKPHNEAS